MKKTLIPTVACLSALMVLTGCVFAIGSGDKCKTQAPTVGQQLVDLQKAKDSGAINDAEFQAQKAKILGK
jgi:hypothetical protein